MEVLITLFYVLFCICVVYPPTEFVSAGFTIAQLFDSYLGSENTNFIAYHMKRISLTALIHSYLPMGYVICLWCNGATDSWLITVGFLLTAIPPLLVGYEMCTWWERDKSKHPVVKVLLPYVTEGSDWRVVAASLNVEFRSVDKVSVQLTVSSKFVATETWLIKVTQYGMDAIKQRDCNLEALATESHELSLSGEDEAQYVNVAVLPSRNDVREFTVRLSASALRDVQPRLVRPVRVPDHLRLQPTLVERFIHVFKQYVDENPVYYVNEELEQCIGCMQAPADVKLDRRCEPPPALLEPLDEDEPAPPPCRQCNCRVLWCVSCMARWWAARAGPAAGWLEARGSCPVCRATFCLRDVRPARSTTDNNPDLQEIQ